MIKGIIFDYGGTIDTDALHWAEVIWKGYQQAGVRIPKDIYRLAYVHGERSLAKFPLIKPEHNFLDLLRIKINIQTSFLVDAKMWTGMDKNEKRRLELSEQIASFCYDYVLQNLKKSRGVVESLSREYPLVLVSNFYGNIHTILSDFSLNYFNHVIESAVVGIRKPDPRIFKLGVDALQLQPEEVLVVGDAFDKDIIPAHSIGCKTIWMKGVGWNKDEQHDESLPDGIIDTILKLPDAVNSLLKEPTMS